MKLCSRLSDGSRSAFATIFKHYYREDYLLEESANALGLTVAAAKSRLLRARRALRSSLEKRKISPADVRL